MDQQECDEIKLIKENNNYYTFHSRHQANTDVAGIPVYCTFSHTPQYIINNYQKADTNI
jgi:hypothetical protein